MQVLIFSVRLIAILLVQLITSEANLKLLVPVISNQIKFVTGYGSGVAVFAWDGVAGKTLSPEHYLSIYNNPTEALECGKADPSGRLWIGTSYWFDKDGKEVRGKLYSVDKGIVTPRLGSYNTPSGIEWSKDKKYMYYADITTRVVYKSSFNIKTAEITNGSVFFDFARNNMPGSPSGMTVDSEGYLWVACKHMPYVLKLDYDTGVLLAVIEFPGINSISDVTFCGTREDMYMTTEKDANAKSGTLFHVTNTSAQGIGHPAIDVRNWPKP